ncbi:Predicted amidohydrolase [Cyclobacterium xiamenense]|uniref:Predicted amidohydrolase n=1 Tax=Cyclobacterium xiamenense TaxID=1297121 RepID=A0A1H6UHZ9_9BACT|nr:carbon-nitrogen hydrolase family protein [Cyclobacterium xiamenense]SEI87745.1 Predicted amidohydrolase [Cyclobacterium xiamenense]
MKIAIAQIKTIAGNFPVSLVHHERFIYTACKLNADLLVFPELSLMGYDPKQAKKLAMERDDKRLDRFQELSNRQQLVIGIGVPEKTATGVGISTFFYQPKAPRRCYSKQVLHPDESPYFEPGTKQVFLRAGGLRICPAICYESLLPSHAKQAFTQGADLYLASVAKKEAVVTTAANHYSWVARTYSMAVLMANSVGNCAGFESAGASAVWTKTGKLAGQLPEEEEGILVYDTETEEVQTQPMVH